MFVSMSAALTLSSTASVAMQLGKLELYHVWRDSIRCYQHRNSDSSHCFSVSGLALAQRPPEVSWCEHPLKRGEYGDDLRIWMLTVQSHCWQYLSDDVPFTVGKNFENPRDNAGLRKSGARVV